MSKYLNRKYLVYRLNKIVLDVEGMFGFYECAIYIKERLIRSTTLGLIVLFISIT